MKSILRGGFLWIAAAVVLIGAAVWFVSGGGESDGVVRGRELRARKIADAKAAKKAAKRVGLRKAKDEKVAAKVAPVKPSFREDIDDESKLTGKMREIFTELQAALDAEDKKTVFALVRKLQAMDEWPDDIPRAVKLKALDSLAWFGSEGMAEAVGFLADADPEVTSTAIEKFDEMLSDCEGGDRAVSSILKQLSKVVHDADALDSFYMELNNMRPTVKAETVLAVLDSGNKDAISVMNENLEFIFSDAEVDYEIMTRKDVEQYLKDAEQAYKDDPEKARDDEEFYGAQAN